MRRIMLVVTVALVMAAILVASAMPAFAAPNEDNNASCRGDALSTYAAEGGLKGDGSSQGAHYYQQGGTNNYGQDFVTTQAHNTHPRCSVWP